MEGHLELSKIIQALESARQAWPERVCTEQSHGKYPIPESRHVSDIIRK